MNILGNGEQERLLSAPQSSRPFEMKPGMILREKVFNVLDLAAVEHRRVYCCKCYRFRACCCRLTEDRGCNFATSDNCFNGHCSMCVSSRSENARDLPQATYKSCGSIALLPAMDFRHPNNVAFEALKKFIADNNVTVIKWEEIPERVWHPCSYLMFCWMCLDDEPTPCYPCSDRLLSYRLFYTTSTATMPTPQAPAALAMSRI